LVLKTEGGTEKRRKKLKKSLDLQVTSKSIILITEKTYLIGGKGNEFGRKTEESSIEDKKNTERAKQDTESINEFGIQMGA